MTMSLDDRIKAALDDRLKGAGVLDFEDSSSAVRKASEVLETVARTGWKSLLGQTAFISIGGADGAELAHLLQNTDAKHGLLFEFDDDLSARAHERATQLAVTGKTMRVFTGDVNQKLDAALEVIHNWAEAGLVRSLVVSMHAVLHELPNRGSQTDDLEALLSRFLWRNLPVLAIAREPCMPPGLPERVYLKADCRPDTLAELARRIRSAHPLSFGQQAAPEPMATHVRMSSLLAVETIWKLFYLDSLRYELEERVTSFARDDLLKAFNNVFGTAQVESSALQSGSFNRFWSHLGIHLQSEDRRELPKPEIHARIVAHWTPPSDAGADGTNADDGSNRLQSEDGSGPKGVNGPESVGPPRRPTASNALDLWTPGPSRDVMLATFEPLVGPSTAAALWRESQSAISAIARGDFAEQVAVAKRVAALVPTSPHIVGQATYLEAEGLRLLADIASGTDRRQRLQVEAIEKYRHASEMLDGDPRPIRGIGRALEVRGDLNQALEHFHRAKGLCITGLAGVPLHQRPDLAHEALRVSRHLVHCLLDLRKSSPTNIWNREHKRQELEGLLVECENLHRQNMPVFASAVEWSRIEWFMGLLFIARAWSQLGNDARARQLLVFALAARQKLLPNEGQLSPVEQSNLRWWLSVAVERMATFDSRSQDLLERLASTVETGSRAEVRAIVDDFLFPLIPPWEQSVDRSRTTT